MVQFPWFNDSYVYGHFGAKGFCVVGAQSSDAPDSCAKKLLKNAQGICMSHVSVCTYEMKDWEIMLLPMQQFR